MEKTFKPTNWAIGNRTSVLIITAVLCFFGVMTYQSLPKENFPEIVIPTIYVSTAYPGTSPVDMESLVTRPIEKQIKSISGVRKITSNSVQDFSNVIVEFNTNVDPSEAKSKVKDAVDKARSELPGDLPQDPNVMEIDFSELPIMNVNISGNYDLDRLKIWAEELQDRIEGLKEITRADLIGALDREIRVNVNMFSMQAAKVSLYDIQQAVSRENITMSAGQIEMGQVKRSLRVAGEFTSVEQLENIVIRSMSGAQVRLREIAEIDNSYAERKSFARYNGNNVITLNIIKRSGENLIEASDKIKLIIDEMQETRFPEDLTVAVSGDQSERTRTMLTDLINSIIIGFVLVTIVLMFFMGPNNAMFVGLSVPISIFIAFMVMPGIDFTLNLMVLFSFLFSLGIVVDDAIVVIENTHRIFYENKGKMSIIQAARIAAGEVFIPVLTGTLTTIAPFMPLAFWPGIAGKFMMYLPITIMLTLTASLLVSYIINPVFAVVFMKYEDEGSIKKHQKSPLKGLKVILGFMIVLALVFYFTDNTGKANFISFLMILLLLNRFVLRKMVFVFNDSLLPWMMDIYEKTLRWSLLRYRPLWIVAGLVLLFFLTIGITIVRSPKIEFFPQGDPNNVDVYMTLPVGTDIKVTDSLTKVIENRVDGVFGKNNSLVESIVANVGVGAGNPMDQDRSITPNKGKVAVSFVAYAERNGVSTGDYMEQIRKAVQGIPGAEISVEQQKMGPPTGKPVNIEVSSEDIDQLVGISSGLKRYLDSLQVPGVDELKSDFELNNPEIIVNINREKASREGISTAQVASEIRSGLFGVEVSRFRDNEEEYPIMVRYSEKARNNINTLLSARITYRDMNSGGKIRSIPLAAIADIEYSSTYGGIKRKGLKRVITLSSSLLTGFTPDEVNKKLNRAIGQFELPEGVEVKLTGEKEDQQEAMVFLQGAFLIAFLIIFLILVVQFNSLSKPIIILSEVIFSVIGVFLGFAVFGMNMSVVMTGFGIVGLGGIVVKNGILLIEFMDEMLARGQRLPEAIVMGCKLRLKPVMLTAVSTILGLLAMAVGFNINFVTLFTELNPHIFFGGDNVNFFGPLSWTIIFGLLFATVLTLVVLPVMYFLLFKTNEKIEKLKLWLFKSGDSA
ncbi:MAG: efflux RND transporter permease subunit [Cyclobacteriaceae bacterium]|nr:efflux RND transporter permease subunit [Cyclobacteriaceae bacterium]